MPHGNRRSRRSASSKKAIAYKKPSASNQRAQIASLASKVATNERKLRGLRYRVLHRTRLSMNIQGSVATPYKVLSLNAPSLMQLCFSATNENQGAGYNLDHKGMMHIQYNIVSNNEPSPLPLQVFIVSVKNQKVANELGLNQSPVQFNMQADRDYISNIAAATFLSKERFHIHKHWSINLSPILALSQGVPAQWQGDLHPIHRKFSMKQPLAINSRTGPWQTSVADNQTSVSQRVFMVIFNNNISQTSTYPVLNGLVLSSAYTTE